MGKKKKKMPKKEIINEMAGKFGALGNPKNISILYYLSERDNPASRKEISEGVGILESSISKYMEKLEDEGYVKRIKQEGTKELRYKLKKDTKYILDKIYEMALDDIKMKAGKYKLLFEKYDSLAKEK